MTGKSTRLAMAEIRSQATLNRAWIILLVVFSMCSVTLSGVVNAGLAPLLNSLQYKSALNVIRVFNTPESQKPINPATLQALLSIKGVKSASVWAQMDFETHGDSPAIKSLPVPLWASPHIEQLTPPLVAGAVPKAGLGERQILVPSTRNAATDKALVGTNVDLTYTVVAGDHLGRPSEPVAFTIVGVVDTSIIGRAGPSPSFIAPDTFLALRKDSGMSGSAVVFDDGYVAVDSVEQVSAIQNEIARQGFGVESAAGQSVSLSPLLGALQKANPVVLILLCLGSALLGSTMGSNWVRLRRRDVGLLYSLGWSRRTLVHTIALELGAIALFSGAVGALLGTLASLVGTTVLAQDSALGFDITPWTAPSWQSILAAICAPLLFVVIGGALSMWRTARISPDEALRDL